MASYCGMPLMAIAITGVILVVILYFEGEFSKRRQANKLVASGDTGEEDLFDD